MHKKITVHELRSLFGVFEEENRLPIEYRICTGRMKGQAFVKFIGNIFCYSSFNFCTISSSIMWTLNFGRIKHTTHIRYSNNKFVAWLPWTMPRTWHNFWFLFWRDQKLKKIYVIYCFKTIIHWLKFFSYSWRFSHERNTVKQRETYMCVLHSDEDYESFFSVCKMFIRHTLHTWTLMIQMPKINVSRPNNTF